MSDAEPWDAWVAAKQSSILSVSYEGSSIGEYATFDNGEELFVDEGEHPLRIASSRPALGDTDATATRRALAELVLGS